MTEKKPTLEPFGKTLADHGLSLTKGLVETIQINMGYLCNQACKHCHLNAGPGRTAENMTRKTAEEVTAYALRAGFASADITGGAPELNPHLPMLIEGLAPRMETVTLRSNLSALLDTGDPGLFNLLKTHRVAVAASFPSLDESEADSQRGSGTFQKSILCLKKLNSLGYGMEGSGLTLNLVVNPTGAFLPPSQEEAEEKYKRELKDRYDIRINQLFTFANVPLGRFKKWLVQTGNHEHYIKKLASEFNPGAAEGLMCRTMVSVSWDGFLYDCDFNQAAGLGMQPGRVHVSSQGLKPAGGLPINTADHCYACMSGSGFT